VGGGPGSFVLLYMLVTLFILLGLAESGTALALSSTTLPSSLPIPIPTDRACRVSLPGSTDVFYDLSGLRSNTSYMYAMPAASSDSDSHAPIDLFYFNVCGAVVLPSGLNQTEACPDGMTAMCAATCNARNASGCAGSAVQPTATVSTVFYSTLEWHDEAAFSGAAYSTGMTSGTTHTVTSVVIAVCNEAAAEPYLVPIDTAVHSAPVVFELRTQHMCNLKRLAPTENPAVSGFDMTAQTRPTLESATTTRNLGPESPRMPTPSGQALPSPSSATTPAMQLEAEADSSSTRQASPVVIAAGASAVLVVVAIAGACIVTRARRRRSGNYHKHSNAVASTDDDDDAAATANGAEQYESL
jgi:hypothetical protein